ncbi:hypothetical protein CAEBREN_32189 [Caenorhabditis brenneri]|uniref:ATP-dependent DNA helicase n=1 Tax=Caenorhabditis brenneri TaxID=135651 RepID=G0PDY8_CAEBE|nr:hypothetical protein CAEBREN_32189 [Caenorhabditis brenneri]
MDNITVSQLRENITKFQESFSAISDFVERFVETSGLNPNDVIDFPLLFGNQNRAVVQIDGFQLNNDQLRIYNRILSKLKTGSPFYVFVSGPAGSGKSLLLKALKNAIKQHFNSDPDSCLVTAPTIIAARNIDGGTTHSILQSWKADADHTNFSPRKKSESECKIKKTKVLLIDGINYVDAKMFCQIDQKLRSALDAKKPFGGIPVIVFGDLYQIQFFGGDSIWQEENSKKLWNMMRLEELTKNENVTEPEESDVFDILRSGNNFLTSSMIDYLKKKCEVVGSSKSDVIKALEKLKMDNPNKSFAVLAFQNEFIKDINKEILATLREVKDIIPKKCVFNLEGPTDMYPQNAPDKIKNISLAIGAQVMLTAPVKNHNHGEIGRVLEISEEFVSVRFPTETVQVTRCGWNLGKLGWLQFPLVHAEAFTIHKSQGLMFDGVILVGKLDERQSSAIYTALSRAKSLKLCRITHLSTLDDLKNRDIEKEKAEMDRLRSSV